MVRHRGFNHEKHTRDFTDRMKSIKPGITYPHTMNNSTKLKLPRGDSYTSLEELQWSKELYGNSSKI